MFCMSCFFVGICMFIEFYDLLKVVVSIDFNWSGVFGWFFDIDGIFKVFREVCFWFVVKYLKLMFSIVDLD